MNMFNGKRILLVEDSPSLARVYANFLRDEPYETVVVATGGEALAELEARPPDGLRSTSSCRTWTAWRFSNRSAPTGSIARSW